MIKSELSKWEKQMNIYEKLACDFSDGNKVVLKKFNGTSNPINQIKESENYWKLIGLEGLVVKTWQQADFPMEHPRFLIRFFVDIRKMNLISHNEIDNSLWILESDIDFA